MDREVDHYNEWIAVCIIVIVICGLGTLFLSRMVKSELSGVDEIKTRHLMANVKGSIYSDGEAMTVFGTCLDAYDVPVINSTAYLSAWYPNGSQFIFDDAMDKMQEGYFMWAGTMSLERGTYLTQMQCFAEMDGINQTAKAFGEWQNPYWVNSLLTMNLSGFNISMNLTGNLSELYILLNNTYALVSQVYEQNGIITAVVNDTYYLVDQLYQLVNGSYLAIMSAIQNLSDKMDMQFNATIQNITYLNYTMVSNFNQTNELILDTQVIANSSVDRNNSLLAQLLYYLLNWSQTPNPFCGNLTADQYSVGIPRYWFDWTIKVAAKDIYNNTIEYPDAYCLINTTQFPTQTYMTPEGNHFTYTEFNKIKPGDPFDWTVVCGCS